MRSPPFAVTRCDGAPSIVGKDVIGVKRYAVALALALALVLVLVLAGCGGKAPVGQGKPAEPTGQSAPAEPAGQGKPSEPAADKLLTAGDLDGDGKADAVFGTPRGEAYTAIRAVSTSSAELLRLTEEQGGTILGALVAQVGAPSPVLVVSTAGGSGGDLIYVYLYDSATQKLKEVPWAGAQAGLGKASVDPQTGSLVVEVRDMEKPVVYRYENGQMTPAR